MTSQKLSWLKVAKWLLGFALGKFIFDYFTAEEIDYYGVVFIPIITLILIYIVDKKQLMQDEN